MFKLIHKIHQPTTDHYCAVTPAPRVRPLASPRTGSGRCPGQNWFPAFPTELVRGLKAHGKTRTEAELNRLNMSEGWANFVLTRFIVAFAGYLRAKHDA